MPQITGTPGNDLLLGTTGNDTIDGLEGDDKLFGGASEDTLNGGDGGDLLDGGEGRDIMSGGAGNDFYYVNYTDSVRELSTEGYDTVFLLDWINVQYDLPTNVERLISLSSSVVRLYGNDLANEIIGSDSDNVLYGGIDNQVDTLAGRGGDDVYFNFGNGPLDLVLEEVNGGFDHVITRNSDYRLPDNVEMLTGYNGDLTGNSLDNVIYGGADTVEVIDGGAGADKMTGYTGSDVYLVDNAGDQVIEAANGGYDTVFVDGIDYTLPDNVERGAATYANGLSAFNLTGNSLNNELSGNDGANWLDGKLGRDILTGYGGADTFAFTTKVDGDNADLFVGFEVGIDKIALDDAVFTQLTAGALPDSVFHIGREAADADDRILYEASTGNLFYDPDGTGPLASQYFASMHEGLNLSASDFIVI